MDSYELIEECGPDMRSYPIVFGDTETGEGCYLAERIDEHRTRHVMWYVGAIVHDEVSRVVGNDGRFIFLPLREIEEFQQQMGSD